MTNTIENTPPSLAEVAKPQFQFAVPPAPDVRPESNPQTIRLPTTSECATHLQLLNAIVRLKNAVEDWGHKRAMPEGQAWIQFCEAAAARFLKWSENVDTSGQTIPVPSLDILMVWHSFMLNPRDYMRYAIRVIQGRLGGKGIDWQQLKVKLDSDPENTADYLASLSNTGFKTVDQQDSSRASHFDMVAAIQRQLKFSVNMYNAKYLKSQFVEDILTNAIDRYEKFFTLIAENPGVGIAPTQDIDLVWHTHQLWPKSYASYSRERTEGRFVNHNDNLDDDTLKESGDNGEALFFQRFGMPYRICLCEHCVALRFGPHLHNHDGPGGPKTGVHAGPATGAGPARDSCSDACSTSCMQCRNECVDDCSNCNNCNARCLGNCGRECGYVCGSCSSSKVGEKDASASASALPAVVGPGGDPRDSCNSCSSCSTACKQSYCRGGNCSGYYCRGRCGETCGYVCGACDTKLADFT